jgi:predicted dinucleotide-binding enzyme
MTDPIRWGILGTGKIARAFAEALTDTPGAVLAAVASRSIDNAQAFAAPHKAAAFSSYQALADAPDIDIVYIATPHPMHVENARMLLNAGKGSTVRKAVHHEPARGGRNRCPRARAKTVPDGSHVDPLHARARCRAHGDRRR